MKNKNVWISVLMLCIMMLSGCGTNTATKGIPKDLVLVMPNKKELTLYMPREEAEKLIEGEGKGIGKSRGLMEYDGFSVGYTDGVISCLIINDEEDAKIKSGMGYGTKYSEFLKKGYKEVMGKSLTLLYKYENNTFISMKDITMSEFSTYAMEEFKKSALVDVSLNEDGARCIMIVDGYVAYTMKYDK